MTLPITNDDKKFNVQSAGVLDFECKTCQKSFFIFRTDLEGIKVCPFCGPTEVRVEVEVEVPKPIVYRKRNSPFDYTLLDPFVDEIKSMVEDQYILHPGVAKILSDRLGIEIRYDHIAHVCKKHGITRRVNATDQQTQAE